MTNVYDVAISIISLFFIQFRSNKDDLLSILDNPRDKSEKRNQNHLVGQLQILKTIYFFSTEGDLDCYL
ncbi:hypothetical protein CMK15_12565 [Candidatus Poribacteria bacterium]|nr:hypothetical protein [Candidatus Poribacteria bacterium]